jgi:hypothetical protein
MPLDRFAAISIALRYEQPDVVFGRSGIDRDTWVAAKEAYAVALRMDPKLQQRLEALLTEAEQK